MLGPYTRIQGYKEGPGSPFGFQFHAVRLTAATPLARVVGCVIDWPAAAHSSGGHVGKSEYVITIVMENPTKNQMENAVETGFAWGYVGIYGIHIKRAEND